MNIIRVLSAILAVLWLVVCSSCFGANDFFERTLAVRQDLENVLASAMKMKSVDVRDHEKLVLIAPLGKPKEMAKQWLLELAEKIPSNFKHEIRTNKNNLDLIVSVEDKHARWEISVFLSLDRDGDVVDIAVDHALWAKR